MFSESEPSPESPTPEREPSIPSADDVLKLSSIESNIIAPGKFVPVFTVRRNMVVPGAKMLINAELPEARLFYAMQGEPAGAEGGRTLVERFALPKKAARLATQLNHFFASVSMVACNDSESNIALLGRPTRRHLPLSTVDTSIFLLNSEAEESGKLREIEFGSSTKMLGLCFSAKAHQQHPMLDYLHVMLRDELFGGLALFSAEFFDDLATDKLLRRPILDLRDGGEYMRVLGLAETAPDRLTMLIGRQPQFGPWSEPERQPVYFQRFELWALKLGVGCRAALLGEIELPANAGAAALSGDGRFVAISQDATPQAPSRVIIHEILQTADRCDIVPCDQVEANANCTDLAFSRTGSRLGMTTTHGDFVVLVNSTAEVVG